MSCCVGFLGSNSKLKRRFGCGSLGVEFLELMTGVEVSAAKIIIVIEIEN